MLLHSS